MRRRVPIVAGVLALAVAVGVALATSGPGDDEEPQSKRDDAIRCLPMRVALDTADGDVGVADEDCHVTLVTRGVDVEAASALSPDGERLAFVRFSESETAADNRSELVVLDLPSARERVLLTSERGYVDNPSWSPDGTQLAYSFDDLDNGKSAIWVHDLATDSASLFHRGSTSLSHPRWSPDGDRILFLRSGDPPALVIASANGAAVLSEVIVDVSGEGRGFVGMGVWSPDGTRIAVLHGDTGTAGIAYTLLVVDEDANVLEQSEPIDGYLESMAWLESGILAALDTSTVTYDDHLTAIGSSPISVSFN